MKHPTCAITDSVASFPSPRTGLCKRNNFTRLREWLGLNVATCVLLGLGTPVTPAEPCDVTPLSQPPVRVFPTNVTPSPSPLAYKIAQNGMTCLSPENEESFVIPPRPTRRTKDGREAKRSRERGFKSARRLSFCGGNASSFDLELPCERERAVWRGTSFFLRWKKGLNIYPLPLRRRRKERRSEREGEKVAVILCGTKAIAFSSSWRRRRRRRAIARDSYYWVTFRVNKKAPAFAPRPGCS